ncbi:hypothetical protein EIP86_004089 [Pleurotus ostreatoroseus]|nr:hypothetical protein EIP86_004089 [Pleurotus ostreatoroseus]
MKNGYEASINSAVRRRESILAAASKAATEATESTEAATVTAAASAEHSTALASTSDGSSQAANSQTVSQASSAPSSSSSQRIAQAVLSGKASQPFLSPDMARLSAALSTGSGVPGNPLVVTISEPTGSWIPRLVRFVVLTCLGAFFLVVIFAVLLENSGLMKAGPRQTEFEPQQGKTYKFSDVHGVDEAKDELKEVVEFLKDPTHFTTLGGKLPKGILLTGPPGTGKTLLARAVAGEAGVPFFFASGSEFDEMFVGVGAKRVRDLFSNARKKQPAIIFIDELDAIGGKRSSRDQHYMKQTLNQLLVEMDGFLQNEGLIVIAATNFPDSLDPALVRPGRFDRHIAVPLPDVRGRAQILTHHMKDVTTAMNVNTMVLARGTAGFSGADLQNMVNQAAVQAAKEGAVAVELKHFEWAKDRILMGAERKSAVIGEKEKLMTAYHEGGHALVALYTEGSMPLHKVTCMPRGQALGITTRLPEDDRYSVSFKQYVADIDVCMGGRVAEALIYGIENVTSGCSSDLRQATDAATAMVKRWGMSKKIGPVYYSDRGTSAQKQAELDAEIHRMLVESESRVSTLLKTKEEELHRVSDTLRGSSLSLTSISPQLATALVEHETLDAEEVRKVIKGESIRNITEVIQEDLSRMSETQPPQTRAQPQGS